MLRRVCMYNFTIVHSIIIIIIYPYTIVTCHIRPYEVSKCTFALTTKSISADQKILYYGQYRISDLLRDFCMTSQLVTLLI